jgi:DNA-binding MarR family transcriptional regulator
MNADILNNLTSLIPDVARILLAQADQMARRRRIVRSMYWPILMRLKRSPSLSQNEVAAMIGAAPVTITRLVDRLEALGLVRRYRGEDRRIWRLRLTREAASLVQEISRCQAEMRYSMALGIDPSILDTAHMALCKMRDNLSRLCPRRP